MPYLIILDLANEFGLYSLMPVKSIDLELSGHLFSILSWIDLQLTGKVNVGSNLFSVQEITKDFCCPDFW